ncbi:MAG: GNAT family N-acetyltransferase [Limnohabitans sp.]|nr:GNAT family N-acetyltransferase [Limnohabitans sp.]
MKELLTSSITTSLLAREICRNDIEFICSWVRTQRMLSMVSGDIGCGLSPKILKKWIEDSICTIVIIDSNNYPIGFCTLTTKELPTLKQKHVELCHLIVNPNYYPKYDIAKQLCYQAIKKGNNFGFSFIVGRVVPINEFGNILAEKLNWNELFEPLVYPVNFNWYIKNL